MSHSTANHDGESLSATSSDSDSDDDEGLQEDMAAIARACMITGHDTAAADETPPEYDDDPLLAPGDALVPLASDSDDERRNDIECLKRVQSLYNPLPDHPLSPLPTVSDDDEEENDAETLRAIYKRFSNFERSDHEGGKENLAEGNQVLSIGSEGDIAGGSCYKSDAAELYPDNAAHLLTGHFGNDFLDCLEPDDAGNSSQVPQKIANFPPAALALIDAIKKNRAYQRFLRSKIIEMESKIEENEKIKNNIKLVKDFQISCNRRTGSALALKKDPRVQLISTKKSPAPNKSKNKKVSPMCYGPEENPRVANYRMVLERFPLSIDRKRWSNVERENLSKGIKQQFQEMVLQTSLDRTSSDCSNDMDSMMASVKDLEITPARMREFLPKVNWDQLASMYVAGRSGAECVSRWLNCEDPLINHAPWTGEEDRSLLIIVQSRGIRNWVDISVSLATNRTPFQCLATNRTPFQCLARYQRSLNPSMLNSEWTEEEDAQLTSAVAFFGESDWQSVASVLERRTGTQCSNRWKKSLCPVRRGSFSLEEDKRLTVAVMLFGRKWNLIAKYIPGRIQSQCRDRYLNSLDPSLKWGGWTEEEDAKLEAAIAKHGYCWSKIAEEVPPRTDSQCRKRWKVLYPEQVPLLQEARKRQKTLISNNFVDRESERPALTLNDFIPIQMLAGPSEGGPSSQRKRNTKSSDVPKKRRYRKSVKKAEEGQDRFITFINFPKKFRSTTHARMPQLCLKEVDDMMAYNKGKICIESSESEDGDLSLASLLQKSKNRRVKCTKNVIQASTAEQDGTGETHDLSLQHDVAFDGYVRKPEDANGDNDDMPLACLLGDKSKKRCQAAKGGRAGCSKVKKGVKGRNKPTIIAYGSGSSVAKLVEEDTVLPGGVSVIEPPNADVEEHDDEPLASFLKDRKVKTGRRPRLT